jgi:hypothetical protein
MTKFVIYEQVGDKAYPHYFKSFKDFEKYRRNIKRLIASSEVKQWNEYTSPFSILQPNLSKKEKIKLRTKWMKLKKVI